MEGPSRTKHRKTFRGKMHGLALRGAELSMGEYALKSVSRHWINAKQLESARKAIVKEMKRKGKLWIRVFPDKPFTKKPAEVRMGKGKGDVEGYVAVIKPGRILFELSGVSSDVAHSALHKAAQKLPILTKVISKQH